MECTIPLEGSTDEIATTLAGAFHRSTRGFVGMRVWEPLQGNQDLHGDGDAIDFVLARKSLFLNSSSDLVIFERTLRAVANRSERIDAPSDEAMRQALEQLGAQPLFVPGLDDVGLAPA